MDQFLERHKLPKLTQGEIDNLKSPISIKETESIINNLSKQKAQDSDASSNKFCHTLRKKF